MHDLYSTGATLYCILAGKNLGNSYHKAIPDESELEYNISEDTGFLDWGDAFFLRFRLIWHLRHIKRMKLIVRLLHLVEGVKPLSVDTALEWVENLNKIFLEWTNEIPEFKYGDKLSRTAK